MKLKELFTIYHEKFNKANIEPSEIIYILCYALKRDKVFIYSNKDYDLGEDEIKSTKLIMNKRLEGIPFQYIKNNQEFMGLDFYVDENVLIPRPDTETLVEYVIEAAKKFKKKKVRVLDIGTGSGCIATSIAYYINHVEVVAVDISEAALKVAKENIIRNHVINKVKLLKSNLFEALNHEDKFEIIVSNLPYIKTCDIDLLQREVKCHEPIIALDGGKSGYIFYEKMIERVDEFLTEDGFVAFEVGVDQSEYISKLLLEKSFIVSKHKDISKIERVVVGHKKV